MFLDLIGTCHSELRQPVILKPEHLVLYKLHWSRRLDPQGSLTAMQQDNKVGFDREGMLCPEVEVKSQREMKHAYFLYFK